MSESRHPCRQNADSSWRSAREWQRVVTPSAGATKPRAPLRSAAADRPTKQPDGLGVVADDDSDAARELRMHRFMRIVPILDIPSLRAVTAAQAA